MAEPAQVKEAIGKEAIGPKISVEWSSSEEDCRFFDRLLNSPLFAAKLARMGLASVSAKSIYNLPGVRFLVVTVDGEAAGFFLFCRRPDSNWEAHTLLGPDCRGARAIEAGQLGLRAFFSAVDVGCLFSYCPFDQLETRLFARALGFEVIGPDDKGVHVKINRPWG